MTSSDKAASAKTPDVHVAAIAEPTAAMVAAFLAGASLGVSIAYALIGNNTVAAYLAGLCSAIGLAFAWKLAESHKKIADALIARLLQDEHAKAKREFASQLRALQAATADDWNADGSIYVKNARNEEIRFNHVGPKVLSFNGPRTEYVNESYEASEAARTLLTDLGGTGAFAYVVFLDRFEVMLDGVKGCCPTGACAT